ncbi:MAG: hypothetical protein AAF217_10355 [Pseudomonadota bacterium]
MEQIARNGAGFYLIDHPDCNCSWKVKVFAPSFDEAQRIIRDLSKTNVSADKLDDLSTQIVAGLRKFLDRLVSDRCF